jgi:hypothetical protein
MVERFSREQWGAIALYWRQTSLGVIVIFTYPTVLRAQVAVQFDSRLPSCLRILLIAADALLPTRSEETIALLGVAALWPPLSSERVFVFPVVATLTLARLSPERSRLDLQHLTMASGLALFAATVFVVGGDLLAKEKGLNDMVRLLYQRRRFFRLPSSHGAISSLGATWALASYADAVSPLRLGLDAVVTPLTRPYRLHK